MQYEYSALNTNQSVSKNRKANGAYTYPWALRLNATKCTAALCSLGLIYSVDCKWPSQDIITDQWRIRPLLTGCILKQVKIWHEMQDFLHKNFKNFLHRGTAPIPKSHTFRSPYSKFLNQPLFQIPVIQATEDCYSNPACRMTVVSLSPNSINPIESDERISRIGLQNTDVAETRGIRPMCMWSSMQNLDIWIAFGPFYS